MEMTVNHINKTSVSFPKSERMNMMQWSLKTTKFIGHNGFYAS